KELVPEGGGAHEHRVGGDGATATEGFVVVVGADRVGVAEDRNGALLMNLEEFGERFHFVLNAGRTNEESKRKRRSSTRQHATGMRRILTVLSSLDAEGATRNWNGSGVA